MNTSSIAAQLIAVALFSAGCTSEPAADSFDSEITVQGVERADGPPATWTARYNESRVQVSRDSELALVMSFSDSGAMVRLGEKQIRLLANEEGFLIATDLHDADLQELANEYDRSDLESLHNARERADLADRLADITGAWSNWRRVRVTPQDERAEAQAALLRKQTELLELQIEEVRANLKTTAQQERGCRTEKQVDAEHARLMRVKSATSCIWRQSVSGCEYGWFRLVRNGTESGYNTCRSGATESSDPRLARGRD